jgi:hypothetical protein
MYRPGSQIRVRISAPNGDQPIWSFSEADPSGQANVDIGYGPDMPSRLDLPVVPGVSAPTGLPPCPGLRGEPCRDYQPLQNHHPGELSSQDQGTQPNAPGTGQTFGAVKKKAKCKKRKHRAAAARKKCRK